MQSVFLSARRLFCLFRSAPRWARRGANQKLTSPRIESLEGRQFLSGAPVTTYTPSQVRHAYGFDQVIFTDKAGKKHLADGSGQTIAIIDTYDDPSIFHDLAAFDAKYGLPNNDTSGKPILTKYRFGSGKSPEDPAWSQEIALDVEWAHAIAPEAHILLVEAKSTGLSDLVQALGYARAQKGVSVVSMSWDGAEFPSETKYDYLFTTPKGHIGGNGVTGGITFVGATGDTGAPSGWPAVSPNVLGVGGTTMRLNKSGAWSAEYGWDFSGGGVSYYEREPYWQQRLAPNVGYRTAPDVAYDANPNTGFSIYDSVPLNGRVGWQTVGGTSGGAPQWAALIAIADQGRAFAGKSSLDGGTQTLPGIYKLPGSDFHDISTGNNGYLASPGYNAVAGRGTPVANKVIPGLVNL
jgi:subtilase family serine protease